MKIARITAAAALLAVHALAQDPAPPRIPPGLNRGYALATKPSVRIDAIYQARVSAPRMNAREWVFFVPRPPDLPSQRILGAETVPAGEVVAERSPLRRPVHRTGIPVTAASLRSAARIEARTEALLFSRRLVRGAGRPVPGLSEADRSLFLRGTAEFNHGSMEVRKWIAANRLERRRDEGEVDFARRVFRHVAEHFRYEYRGEQDRSAPHVCRAGASDCGGLSVLFATVLRSQGVPARILAGRWARSADPAEKVGEVSYRQEHIIAEFFAQGVGWVPADPAGAVMHDKSVGKLEYFGNDPGQFLTLHVDNELLLDTARFGVRKMTLLQRASFWARGDGSVQDAVMTEDWTVKRSVAGG